jgi:hypothetical protein
MVSVSFVGRAGRNPMPLSTGKHRTVILLRSSIFGQ